MRGGSNGWREREPDSQKSWKEGLGDRGGSVLCADVHPFDTHVHYDDILMYVCLITSSRRQK